jgi:L-iditol 2-dehydrogenase
VVEAGSETRRLKVGDRVISDTGYSCGECANCLEGSYQSCDYGRAIGTISECWPGAMAEYMVMPERLTFKVPDNVELDEAALVEPASIGLYGLTRSPMGPGRNLLVIGTGPIGLGGMACAKGMGVGKTLLAGRKDAKLEIGRQMGADVLINTTKESMYDIVMRETDGRGMDIVMDTSGDPSIFNDVMLLLRPSGTLVIPGFYERALKEVHIDRLIVQNCTLVGAAGTPNMGRKVLDLLSNRHISLKEMITDRFHFEDAQEAFEAISARNDRRIKILLEM